MDGAWLVGAAMTMAMTTTAVPRHIFRQSIRSQERNIVGNCSIVRLIYPHPGSIQLVQCTAADTTNNNSLYLMAAKTCHRVACAVLMELVTVVDRRYLAGDHVHYDKSRSRPKMPINLTLQTFIFQNRKTDFHVSTPYQFCEYAQNTIRLYECQYALIAYMVTNLSLKRQLER
jgi:hypothetical protein